MTFLEGIPLLALTNETDDVANRLLQAKVIPHKARIDAIHIVVSAVHGIDYLLTWNLTHIANAAIRGKVEQACRDAGFRPQVICTPEESRFGLNSHPP